MKKAECRRTDSFELCGVGEDSLEDSKEIKPVNPKGNKPWIFTGRTDAETPVVWPPDAKSQLTGKDPDAGKDWGQEEEGKTEDEMVGWYHWLSGHELEDTLRDGEGQGGLARWSPWGRKESDTTEQLNNKNATKASIIPPLPNHSTLQAGMVLNNSQKPALTWARGRGSALQGCRTPESYPAAGTP